MSTGTQVAQSIMRDLGISGPEIDRMQRDGIVA